MYMPIGYLPHYRESLLLRATLAAQTVEPALLATYDQPPYGSDKTNDSFDGTAVCALKAMEALTRLKYSYGNVHKCSRKKAK
jgi:hypothetical protein